MWLYLESRNQHKQKKYILPAADTPWSDNVMLNTITNNTVSEERECRDTREGDDFDEQVWGLRFHGTGINFLLPSSQQVAEHVISIIIRYEIWYII